MFSFLVHNVPQGKHFPERNNIYFVSPPNYCNIGYDSESETSPSFSGLTEYGPFVLSIAFNHSIVWQ